MLGRNPPRNRDSVAKIQRLFQPTKVFQQKNDISILSIINRYLGNGMEKRFSLNPNRPLQFAQQTVFLLFMNKSMRNVTRIK